MIQLANYLLDLFGNLGYGGIVALMTVESSFIPFPSEIIMPPAGYLASQGEFNIILVILAGLLGSLLGAVINYFLAVSLGRIIIYRLAETKIAKLLLINPKKIERSEKYFIKYGKSSTLIGRLVPVIRQLISIPAGLAKMNLREFIIYTAIGALIWNIILAVAGYWFGANQAILIKELHWLSLLGLTLFIFFLFWLVINNKRKKAK